MKRKGAARPGGLFQTLIGYGIFKRVQALILTKSHGVYYPGLQSAEDADFTYACSMQILYVVLYAAAVQETDICRRRQTGLRHTGYGNGHGVVAAGKFQRVVHIFGSAAEAV